MSISSDVRRLIRFDFQKCETATQRAARQRQCAGRFRGRFGIKGLDFQRMRCEQNARSSAGLTRLRQRRRTPQPGGQTAADREADRLREVQTTASSGRLLVRFDFFLVLQHVPPSAVSAPARTESHCLMLLPSFSL